MREREETRRHAEGECAGNLPENSRIDRDFKGNIEAGSILAGKYQVLRELSRGGQGRILLAQDLHLPKKWAVKVIGKELPKAPTAIMPKAPTSIMAEASTDEIASTDETVPEAKAEIKSEQQIKRHIKRHIEKQTLTIYDSMRREAVLLGSRTHPGLPTVVDFIETEENCYLVMEYIEGRTLQEAVRQDGCFCETECIGLMRQTAEILAYLHSLRPPVWHLDIKPANLLLTREKKVMLVDFGAAMEAEEAACRRGGCYGTYGYAPLEQCRKGGEGAACDGRSDIYALGATFYFCLTGQDPGQPPFGIRPAKEWENAYGADFAGIIKRCTEKEQEKRFQTIHELIDALESCRPGSGKLNRYVKKLLHGKRNFILAREKSFFYTAKEAPGLIDSPSEE